MDAQTRKLIKELQEENEKDNRAIRRVGYIKRSLWKFFQVVFMADVGLELVCRGIDVGYCYALTEKFPWEFYVNVL